MENSRTPNTDKKDLTRKLPTGNGDSGTRSIPTGENIGRPIPSGNTAVSRPVPVKSRENAGTSTETRRIPTQKAPTSGNVVPPPKKVISDANAETRQIPIQKSTPTSGNIVPPPKKITSDVNAETRQVPIQKSSPASGNAVPPPKKVTSDTVGRSTINRVPAAEAFREVTKKRTVSEASDNKSSHISHTDSVHVKQSETHVDDPNHQTKLVDTSQRILDEENANSGTRIIKTTSSMIPASGKKSSKLSKSETDSGSGNTIVSIIKAVVYIVSVLVISIAASLFIILVGNDVYAFVKSEDVVEITIPEGADVNDVALILSNNGVIKYPGIFEWYAKHNNDNGEFIAGTYSIACNLDYEDLLSSFKPKEVIGTTWITFPEGFTTDEIIDLLVEKGIGTKEKYIDAINNYPFDYWFVHEIDKTDWKSTGRIYRLDGYLFPDTYEFYNDSSEAAVIAKFLSRFNVIFGKKYREAAETMGMTVDEVVILASMVEKESNNAADIYIISSVFHNRLNNPAYETQGRLESDATVLYSIHHSTGERPTKAPTGLGDPNGEYADDKYNTYRIKGLPPGAIANPSASTLSAALNPENTSYYYFVFDGIENHFSSTKYEHDLIISQISGRAASQAE